MSEIKEVRNLKNTKILGNFGEDEATKYLEKQEYEIIERNFACKQGEIDIIARDGEEIVFVEVKTRKNNIYGKPIEAVNEYKQDHIWRVAKYYLYIHKLLNAYVRFDVIEVYITGREVQINQIKNIFI